jgi:hypothetical protein
MAARLQLEAKLRQVRQAGKSVEAAFFVVLL